MLIKKKNNGVADQKNTFADQNNNSADHFTNSLYFSTDSRLIYAGSNKSRTKYFDDNSIERNWGML